MSIILIILCMFLLYGVLVFYIGYSGWSWIKKTIPSKATWKLKIIYIITLLIVASSFILGRIFENILFDLIGAYWMAIFYLLVFLLPLAHLSVWLLRLTRLPRHYVEKSVATVTWLLLLSLIAYGTFNAYSPTIRTYDVYIAKGFQGHQPLNIVMASDMHFGLLSGKSHAMRMVEEINALHPDLVVFPGDLLDDEIDQFLQQGIDQILAKIDATYGVYASLGNHDRHGGTMEELIAALEKSNMNVLYDEVIMINEQIVLIGRKDRRDSNRASLAELLEGVDRSQPIILLDHQPYDLDIARDQGVDLMLSGHTHHGQIFPGNLLTSRIYENSWGYLRKGSLHSIVSSGYGFWGPPIRLGTRSEIVQIHLFFDSN